MNRIGFFLLNIAVSLYLFVNGILGFANRNNSEFFTMVRTMGFPWSKDFDNALIIVLSICAIIAGVLLLVSVFRNDVTVINVILFIFIVLWVAFIVIVDIIDPLSSSKFDLLVYLKRLSAHLMVLGALFTSTRRFGRVMMVR
jgi:uncharacterized membrane protein YphA (DoxX/SURF4 family)